jgi:predicted DNA-binding protein (MmcQ/YjbR family)
MSPDELTDFIEDLNGVTVDYPFGPETRVHRVEGKIFALDRPDSPESGITLKAPPADVPRLIAGVDGIRPGYHMNKKHWVTVALDGRVPDDHLRELIMEAHSLIVAALPVALRRGLQG